jgi:hypothetical protein
MISITQGHYIIHWWQGTDALKLTTYPPGRKVWLLRIFLERILWKVTEPLIREHWVVHPRLIDHLTKFGISKSKIIVRPPVPLDVSKIVKRRHARFNVAYYYPGARGNRTFKRWIYGLDIIEKLIDMYPQINWICLDGTKNMFNVYETLDAYIRPTRHDGMPRLVMECQSINIPVYWDESFKPSTAEIALWLESIMGFRS